MEVDGIFYTEAECRTLIRNALKEKERQRIKSASYRTKRKAEEPVQPEKPVQAEEPVQPEKPVQAEESVQPEKPVQAEEPVQSEKPVQAEEPVQPEKPVLIERMPHQQYNSRYRDDSLDILPEYIRLSVLQREKDGTGIKIPKLH